MSTLNQDLNAIKAVEDTLTANKVANFAYTQEAYDNNDADGVEEYDFNQEQNIPVADLDILRVNETVLNKGWRSQASAITRMLMNHFLGRLSYNLNKLNDNVSNLLSTLIAKAGNADGFATLDSNGRIPYSQLPESAIEYKGQWDADTNTPTLADGTGTKGDFYIVSVAGTQDLGSGDIQFFVNDRVIYDGSVWSRLSAGDVKSVNNITPVNGNITLTKADVGLGNVDNTSDSDLPALNGTNKFTTAGAYNTLISIAPTFDAEQSYGVGNYVTHQGRLYKCTTAHTGAWDITDFTLISIGEDLEKVAPLNYLLDTEQDQFKKWIDGKEVYRKIKKPAVSIMALSDFSNNVPTSALYDAGVEFAGKLYLGFYADLYTTTDGKTFIKDTDFPSNYNICCLCVFQGKLYVGTEKHGIYVSANGQNFTLTSLISSGEMTNRTINRMFVFNNTLYIGTDVIVYYSTDGTSRAGSIAVNQEPVKSFAEFQNKLYISTDKSNSTNKGLWLSTNGTSATRVKSFPETSAQGFGVFNDKLYIGTRQGIYVTQDGESFTQIFNLKQAGYPYTAVAFCSYRDKLYVCGTAVYSSTKQYKVIFSTMDGINFEDCAMNLSRVKNDFRSIFTYKDKLYCGSLPEASTPVTLLVNTASIPVIIDQSVGSLLDVKLVVDGSNLNPTFAQKAGNQVNLAIPSDAQSALFPAVDVYAVMEYTKP